MSNNKTEVSAWDFVLEIQDWCEKNKCNTKGQRKELIAIIEIYLNHQKAEEAKNFGAFLDCKGDKVIIRDYNIYYELFKKEGL